MLGKVRRGFPDSRDFWTQPQHSLSKSSFANNCTVSESLKLRFACALSIGEGSPCLARTPAGYEATPAGYEATPCCTYMC